MAPRILYAEDDSSMRDIVRDELTREGYTVMTASDGAEAIALIEREPFDLLLLDVRMPYKSGLDVLAFARERKIRSRVIMLTAVDDIGIALKAIKLGANDYVTKPYALEGLLGSIAKVLSK